MSHDEALSKELSNLFRYEAAIHRVHTVAEGYANITVVAHQLRRSVEEILCCANTSFKFNEHRFDVVSTLHGVTLFRATRKRKLDGDWHDHGQGARSGRVSLRLPGPSVAQPPGPSAPTIFFARAVSQPSTASADQSHPQPTAHLTRRSFNTHPTQVKTRRSLNPPQIQTRNHARPIRHPAPRSAERLVSSPGYQSKSSSKELDQFKML